MRLPIYPPEKVSGLLLFIGSVQFLLGLVLAEEVYPDYRVSQTISSLGRPGPSAFVFNSSLFLEGTLVLVATYFLHKAYHRIPVTVFFAVGGLGAMGGALFPEDVYNVHLAISIVSFFAAGLTPFVTLPLQSSPFKYLSISLGTLSFAAAVILAIPQIFYPLGLPYGAVERIVAYPTLLWVVGFGSHIMSRNPKQISVVQAQTPSTLNLKARDSFPDQKNGF
jgi:hypothetical membrane protein